jgi:hypothetical protein
LVATHVWNRSLSRAMEQDSSTEADQLTKLNPRERARIVRIEGHEAAELAGFGLYDEAELALEPAVARKIFVLRLE